MAFGAVHSASPPDLTTSVQLSTHEQYNFLSKACSTKTQECSNKNIIQHVLISMSSTYWPLTDLPTLRMSYKDNQFTPCRNLASNTVLAAKSEFTYGRVFDQIYKTHKERSLHYSLNEMAKWQVILSPVLQTTIW